LLQPIALLKTSPSKVDTIDRTPSPVPTEIITDSWTQEEIVLDIQQKGIKVRDFAYEEPLERVPELFDPYQALAEYDYRVMQRTRMVPITGKMLSRLLDIGWVTYADAKAKLREMDWEALDNYRKKPAYPWFARPFSLPSAQKRLARVIEDSRYLDAIEREILGRRPCEQMVINECVYSREQWVVASLKTQLSDPRNTALIVYQRSILLCSLRIAPFFSQRHPPSLPLPTHHARCSDRRPIK